MHCKQWTIYGTAWKESKIEYMNAFDPTMKWKEDVKKEAKDVSKE